MYAPFRQLSDRKTLKAQFPGDEDLQRSVELAAARNLVEQKYPTFRAVFLNEAAQLASFEFRPQLWKRQQLSKTPTRPLHPY